MSLAVKSTIAAAAVVFISIVVWLSFPGLFRRDSIPIPDEKAVAMEFLARKLSGPGYFSMPENGMREPGGPWIGLEDVAGQMEKVIQERQWGQYEREQLQRLIERLAEPWPERMVGGSRIQLARLNLALDEIKR